MSGEAGWTLTRERYSVFLGQGVNVAVAIPPGDDGSAVGRYFESESRPFRRWLEVAAPALDRLVDEVAASGRLPLMPLDVPADAVDGVVIEKPEAPGAAEHWARYHHGRACPLYLTAGNRARTGHRSMNFRFMVATRVRRADVDWLADRLVEVLLACEPPPPEQVPEPALPPGPEAPPPRSGWIPRLCRKLLRSG